MQYADLTLGVKARQEQLEKYLVKDVVSLVSCHAAESIPVSILPVIFIYTAD